ncbi:MAG: hypothetical protein GY716_22495 [bacterium]|nr:hypothetical protein [bacterium]
MRPCDNPFRSSLTQSLQYVPIGTTWADLRLRLARLDYRASIVGPMGSGKSTLLRTLAEQLRAKRTRVRFHRVELDASADEVLESVMRSRTDDIVCVDRVDRLPSLAWRSIRRAGLRGGLICAGHRTRGLPVLVRCKTNPELLHRLVRELSSNPGLTGRAETLFRKHRGNVREALFELYDLAQGFTPET